MTVTISMTCGQCSTVTALDPSQTELRKRGVYPFRCPGCGSLPPAQRLDGETWVRTRVEEGV